MFLNCFYPPGPGRVRRAYLYLPFAVCAGFAGCRSVPFFSLRIQLLILYFNLVFELSFFSPAARPAPAQTASTFSLYGLAVCSPTELDAQARPASGSSLDRLFIGRFPNCFSSFFSFYFFCSLLLTFFDFISVDPGTWLFFLRKHLLYCFSCASARFSSASSLFLIHPSQPPCMRFPTARTR